MCLINAGTPYVWNMQDDGNVVVYNNVLGVAWAGDCPPDNLALVFLLKVDNSCTLIREDYACDSSGSLQNTYTLYDGPSQSGQHWIR